jgi:hypothetical protein
MQEMMKKTIKKKIFLPDKFLIFPSLFQKNETATQKVYNRSFNLVSLIASLHKTGVIEKFWNLPLHLVIGSILHGVKYSTNLKLTEKGSLSKA